MKAALALLLLGTPAFADPVITLGASLGVRDDALSNPMPPYSPHVYGGARILLSFEPPPPPMPVVSGHVNVSARLVTELLAGVAADVRGEALAGVSLRGDLVLASHGARNLFNMESHIWLGLYLGVRAEVIGKDHQPAAEIVFGEYIYLTRRFRLGIEAGVVLRREQTIDAPGQTAIPPNFIGTVTGGWTL